VITHPFYIAYVAFLIFVFGMWTGDFSARALTGGLGELPSPLVSEMGNSELTVGYVSDTPSDAKYRTNHRMTFDALSPEQIDEECATEWDDEVFACARPWKNQVLMPNPCLYPKEAYASVLCHEMAHLKGWEHEPDLKGWRYWDEPARKNYVERDND
jgi:hypothetical protein